MKDKWFYVVFTTRKHEVVLAGCEADARILAQAEQIKKGNRYEVKFIEICNQ